jgi:hypothetical protein
MPPTSDSPIDVHTDEPDDSPISGQEVPQNDEHPNITVPAKPMTKTDESLSLLGAGQPYKSGMR